MTRGKIIFIDSDSRLHCSTEFNGDMYPEGNGGEVIEKFKEGYFSDCNHYNRFIELFNKRHFSYKSELFEKLTCEKNVLSIKGNWTDYLYVINESDEEWAIIDAYDNSVFLTSKSIAVIRYKEVIRIIHRCIEENSRFTPGEIECEEFVAIIDRLRESTDLVDKVDELFRNSRDNIENDFCNAAGLQISHESIVVNLLKKLMYDRYEWIEYFIYELDYGRSYEPWMITEADGTEIDLSSAEKLYNYLMAEYERKEGEGDDGR